MAGSTMAPPARSSVLVVDDHALLRTGVANIINQERDLFVVAQASNGVEAVEKCLPTARLLLAFGELSAGRSTVTLVQTCRRERSSAAGAQEAFTKRAHALWDTIVIWARHFLS